MKNAPLLHAVEFGLFQCLRGLVRLLPHASARGLGRLLGWVAYSLLPRPRRTALDNLALALPELEPAQREQIARSTFAGMASHATEMLSWERFDATQLCRRITLEGWEHVTEAQSQSGSMFIMTAHFGPFEIVGSVTSLYLSPAAALVRPLDNPRLEGALSALRTRFGITLIPKHGAARYLVRSLEADGHLVVLIDQRVRAREAIEVPFFGRRVQAPSLIARLAVKHAVPVVPVFAYPAPKGCYRIVARPAIWAEPGEDAVTDLTARCTAAVESEIRRQPELWLWMHDRWKIS